LTCWDKPRSWGCDSPFVRQQPSEAGPISLHLACIPTAFDTLDLHFERQLAFDQPAQVQHAVAGDRIELNAGRDALLLGWLAEEWLGRLEGGDDLDVGPADRRHIWGRDLAAHVGHAVRRANLGILKNGRDLLQLSAERFRLNRLNLDLRQFIGVEQAEGHVAMAFFLQQERWRLTTPVFVHSTHFDLAVLRMDDLVPRDEPIA
jgi:hypothetical protein